MTSELGSASEVIHLLRIGKCGAARITEHRVFDKEVFIAKQKELANFNDETVEYITAEQVQASQHALDSMSALRDKVRKIIEERS